MSEWQMCPVCFGHGSLSKPPHIAGDQDTWTDSRCTHPCRVCGGDGIILKPEVKDNE
jgi:hypothetical protein